MCHKINNCYKILKALIKFKSIKIWVDYYINISVYKNLLSNNKI